MPDQFDPYREALVVETETVWPDEYHAWEPTEKQRIAEALHADPAACAHLEYVRLHTGFCRVITVTPADLERLQVGSA
jgi:hypothetical protein